MMQSFSRRTMLAGTGLAAAAIGTPLLGGCSGTQSAAGGLSTSRVPVGGGLILEADHKVVTQPTAGTFKAFSSTCPHAGCAVSRVTAESIECTCHGSHFSLADGARMSGPATTGLTEVPVTVAGDTLTIG
ncbi:Ferredoxin subunit of nitrite reductase or a ring-hydroxylating dioxygenase [Raineyella antarctica]|uniref:Ferredoxin subunit of nitrite reductase or a ring-hydroxylating dioxygenase n=1 Tax=Raineyella antarctica TaxID=1577474 RepID=A0A1G6GMG0_9ACTN|nr:Rieske (2Fe-2S) protein [Raineyella antarctica]SDB83134.1 Ferredoxin subunit of nitrite reductase or a ring-hydroxylating dioxygenase [Raineyella antarctica]